MDNIDLLPEYDCPAIQRCCQAWYRGFRKAEAADVNKVSTYLYANVAYRYAMPPLNSPENARDFLACVVHGMMVGCIIDELGAIWIRAARAAYAMCHPKPTPQRPPRSSSSRSHSAAQAKDDDHFDEQFKFRLCRCVTDPNR